MTLKQLLTLLLVIWNVLVFLSYGWDKYCAVRNRWRLSEKFLLLEGLLLGGAGAWLGGQVFHHKIRKWYFQLIWWLGLALLVGLLYWIWFGGVV
ncbi:DUF1294 domain-containing protein [Streptococcus merionis]|uniref:Membrane protein n=1 Tax=Streptococcus merionis TaxID=400065 RepID=A0A239SNM6_9STRE|nr:DUF1294 domain-containing protein [Streptococcus merionis]SNU87065.1 membrane protein [Streptococcus merionis]